jgi:hypothetical protein
MSVKKSLWISLALAALSLVFLGCPTEASSSTEERPAYEKTALWEAVVAAQDNLGATPVSDVGTDIVEKTHYVTTEQANAFKKAIGEAQSAAYSLWPSIRAIEPTEAEKPALTALAAAQTLFNGYKELQIGTGEEVKKASDLTTGVNKVVVGNVLLDDVAVISTANVRIIIPEGAKLTTAPSKAFNITANTITLTIKKGGALEIRDNTDVTGTFKGKIVVEDGGTFIDRTAGGLLADSADDGSFQINAGGVLISGTTVLVGPTTGANIGQKFQLKSGKMTVEFEKYTLARDVVLGKQINGDANLAGSLEVAALEIDGTLTVADKVDLYGADSATLLTGSSGAKIILAGTGASIGVYKAAWTGTADKTAALAASGGGITVAISIPSTSANWTFSGGSTKFSGHSESGFRLTGLTDVLQWSGTEWAQ